MSWCRAVLLCLMVVVVADLCSGLMLERLPRHIPRSKAKLTSSPVEKDEQTDAPDTSVQRKKMISHPGEMSPFIMKPTWKAIYRTNSKLSGMRKRAAGEEEETNDVDRHELADILRDDDEADNKPDKKKKKKSKMEEKKKRRDSHAKRKRQSDKEMSEDTKEEREDEEVTTQKNQDFQEWLRREYYRNMAKSFASMRRKRDDSSALKKRAKKSIQSPKTTSLSDITDNLRDIEDQLFQDALQTIRDGGDDYEDDVRRQNRVSNDLNLAYDLETMRSAFFRLRETLTNMERDDEQEEEENEYYHSNKKRSRGDCPALEQLTSDCSTLSDIMPDGSLKRLLRRACNWHEVCYTCGKAYGLTSETCDGSFIEQTQTICRNDAPCESTASLLVVPLRQRRVFYKRSNPEVCVEDPCVEAYLREGLAALEEGQYAIQHA